MRRVVVRPSADRRPRSPQDAQEDDEDLVVVSSNVVPVRKSISKRRSGGNSSLQWAQSLLAKPAVNSVLPLPGPPPPPEPEKPGPKCGICLEVMGGSTGRPMASGPCG